LLYFQIAVYSLALELSLPPCCQILVAAS